MLSYTHTHAGAHTCTRAHSTFGVLANFPVLVSLIWLISTISASWWERKTKHYKQLHERFFKPSAALNSRRTAIHLRRSDNVFKCGLCQNTEHWLQIHNATMQSSTLKVEILWILSQDLMRTCSKGKGEKINLDEISHVRWQKAMTYKWAMIDQTLAQISQISQ